VAVLAEGELESSGHRPREFPMALWQRLEALIPMGKDSSMVGAGQVASVGARQLGARSGG
jgi:hypothetical protein